jgi:hypothetical protein
MSPKVVDRFVAAKISDVEFHERHPDAPVCVLASDYDALQNELEAICRSRQTSPLTRARIRHALKGIDWRKAK